MNKIVKRLYGSGRPDLMSSGDAQKKVEFETATLFQKVCVALATCVCNDQSCLSMWQIISIVLVLFYNMPVFPLTYMKCLHSNVLKVRKFELRQLKNDCVLHIPLKKKMVH